MCISNKIITKFGGEIGFKSEWGVGSTFAFTFRLDNILEDRNIDHLKINQGNMQINSARESEEDQASKHSEEEEKK